MNEPRANLVYLEGHELARAAMATRIAAVTHNTPPVWLASVLVLAFGSFVDHRLPEGYELDTLEGVLAGPHRGAWAPDMAEMVSLIDKALVDFCTMMPGSQPPAPAPGALTDTAPPAPAATTEPPDMDLPPGWEFTAESDLLCPCGERVEDDGQCPEGHTSPLSEQGLV